MKDLLLYPPSPSDPVLVYKYIKKKPPITNPSDIAQKD